MCVLVFTTKLLRDFFLPGFLVTACHRTTTLSSCELNRGERALTASKMFLASLRSEEPPLFQLPYPSLTVLLFLH